jgi:hypothetical protein
MELQAWVTAGKDEDKYSYLMCIPFKYGFFIRKITVFCGKRPNAQFISSANP